MLRWRNHRSGDTTTAWAIGASIWGQKGRDSRSGRGESLASPGDRHVLFGANAQANGRLGDRVHLRRVYETRSRPWPTLDSGWRSTTGIRHRPALVTSRLSDV